MSRSVQLILVALGAYVAALAVDHFFDDGRLGRVQLAVMIGSVVGLWAWRSRDRTR